MLRFRLVLGGREDSEPHREAPISSCLARHTRIYGWADPAQAEECSSNGIQMSGLLQETNTSTWDGKYIHQTFPEKLVTANT